MISSPINPMFEASGSHYFAARRGSKLSALTCHNSRNTRILTFAESLYASFI